MLALLFRVVDFQLHFLGLCVSAVFHLGINLSGVKSPLVLNHNYNSSDICCILLEIKYQMIVILKLRAFCWGSETFRMNLQHEFDKVSQQGDSQADVWRVSTPLE